MPVFVDASQASTQEKFVTIGLINNMPLAAFKATERQFVSLLTAASNDIPIALSFYTWPDVQRTESSNHDIAKGYSSIDKLWNRRLDGLIVTGTEPVKDNLSDEPYWESFSKILEWARHKTHSTIWSCLAAHAAVLYMDGIDRHKSDEKHSGVYKCDYVSSHPLTAGASPSFYVPHSRWNGLTESNLLARGYTILALSEDVGVDAFMRQEDSLFLFFQGHPEYESDTLLREYRRDVGRYLRSETKAHPSIPRGYFDLETEVTLVALREKAMVRPASVSVSSVAAVLEEATIENTWSSTAVLIYKNWLQYICSRKDAEQYHGSVNIECPLSR